MGTFWTTMSNWQRHPSRHESAVQIKREILASVCNWEAVAMKVGLGRAERQVMAHAFNV